MSIKYIGSLLETVPGIFRKSGRNLRQLGKIVRSMVSDYQKSIKDSTTNLILYEEG